MLGIEKEFLVFLHAIITGVFVTAVYLSLRVLRRIFRHALWVINIEDFIYWIFVSQYFFVQIYHTSNGEIRWYFVLGVVIGAILMHFFVAFTKKIDQKLSDLMEKKNGKTIDKSGKKDNIILQLWILYK